MKKALLALAIVGLICGVVVGGWLWRSWQLLDQPAIGGDEPVSVDIDPGSSARTILDRLAGAGVLPGTLIPRFYYRFVLDSPPLLAGEYSFGPEVTPREALDKLIHGDVVTRPLVIVEGLTVAETAVEVERQGFAPAQDFLAASQPTLIRDLDPEAPDLEGYLFPDTYQFPRTITADGIVRAMVDGFRRRTENLRGDDPLPPVREWVTLASIVEKETQLDEERPLVAGVYRNRLDRGIGLYADPTIIFALKRAGTWDGNLTRDHLQMESPYNTYRVPGLPPGPICSPGLASLEAAAEPSSEPYLYFVSRNDGTHVFATTLREHNRNVNRWQRQYWQKQRRQRRADEVEDRDEQTEEGAAGTA